MTDTQHAPFTVALLAGASAGLTVDLTLFPIDTIKTRLQSAEGFVKSGGFRGVYAGLASVMVGSAPSAAAFFCTYEGIKKVTSPMVIHTQQAPVQHMTAASIAEVVSCLVRVPTEVVKQRAQATPGLTSLAVLRTTVSHEGLSGLYRGFWSTVIRDVPFSIIQLPLWEYFKTVWGRIQGQKVTATQSGICGALAGATAAALTTPLDVAKTRIMLAESGSSLAEGGIFNSMKAVHSEHGIRGLFAGVVPRVIWISIGGFVFLGMYDKIKDVLNVVTDS